MTISPALFSSAAQSWNTPAEILDPLRVAFGGIGLDPASNPTSIVAATTEWILERDGDSLTRSWAGHGLCFVNPPYNRALFDWASKFAHEAKHDAEIVLLVPARTDTAWWRVAWAASSACLFWAGRVRFLGAPAGAPFPSALLYAGPRWATFLAAYEGRGIGVRP